MFIVIKYFYHTKITETDMYAFFLDIDGTIFDSRIVAQEVIDAMARARAEGHKVFINTARAYIGLA